MMDLAIRFKPSGVAALMFIFIASLLASLLYGTEVLANEVHEAVLKDNLARLNELVTQGKDINSKNKEGLTPLHYAAAIGKLPMIETLLANGADVNAKDDRDVTPLFFATQEGHTEVVKRLLKQGADVNIQHVHGATPLHVAALDGRVEIAKLLLQAGADPLTVNNSPETPLMVAAASGHKELALILSDAIIEMDRHIAANDEFIPYSRLRGAYNGGDISNGRVWGKGDKTITNVSYPADPHSQVADPIDDEIKSLSGSWTMGNVLFMGDASFQPKGLKVSQGTTLFYRIKRPSSPPTLAETTDPATVENKRPPVSKPATTPAVAEAPVTTSSSAYRIQIYAGQTATSTDKVKTQAERQFASTGLQVYEHKEGGLRKLRLGDIGSRAEADTLLTKVRQTGYPSAWIVSPP